MTAARSIVAVVDDDPHVLSATARLLRACGFQPRPFPSAEAFLAREGGDEPDCLVLDVHLPGMSGIELRRRLQTNCCPLPVIFISAAGDEATRRAATQAGCIAYLNKPFDSDALIDAIKKAVG